MAFYSNHAKSVRLKFIADTRPDLADQALQLVCAHSLDRGEGIDESVGGWVQLASTFETNSNMTEFGELLGGAHRPKLGKLGALVR